MSALINAMAEANLQARRDHEQAMTQFLQGQNSFMERLGQSLERQAAARPERPHSLVDPHGVGKPPTLTGAMASDPAQFRGWRIKFRNWVVAGIPEASEVMDSLEKRNQDEITEESFSDLELNYPIVTRLSAQLHAVLIASTADEPFQILTRGPTGPRAGLEGLRRLYSRFDPTGPRSAKGVLRRIVAARPVAAIQLRNGIEDLEKLF